MKITSLSFLGLFSYLKRNGLIFALVPYGWAYLYRFIQNESDYSMKGYWFDSETFGHGNQTSCSFLPK